MPEFQITIPYLEQIGLAHKYFGVRFLEQMAVPGGEVYNLSIRQAMIYLSEVIIKPRLGGDYFGRARMALIEQNPSQLYYDDSSSCFNGDSSELDGLVEHFGEDSILLIRIKGRGTFEGDSRSYHPDGVVKNTVDLWNDKDEQSFLEAGSKIIEEFLNRG